MAEFVKNNKRNKRKNNNDNFFSKKGKKRNYGSDSDSIITPPSICSELVEYKMSKEMADGILKELGQRGAPQKVLCDYVNTYFGLKGYCVKVVIG